MCKIFTSIIFSVQISAMCPWAEHFIFHSFVRWWYRFCIQESTKKPILAMFSLQHGSLILICPGILRFYYQCLVAQSCMILFDPIDCRPPGSSVHGFPKQEYWSELSFPFQWDLLDPGIETISWVSLISRQILYHCTTPLGKTSTFRNFILKSDWVRSKI